MSPVAAKWVSVLSEKLKADPMREALFANPVLEALARAGMSAQADTVGLYAKSEQLICQAKIAERAAVQSGEMRDALMEALAREIERLP